MSPHAMLKLRYNKYFTSTSVPYIPLDTCVCLTHTKLPLIFIPNVDQIHVILVYCALPCFPYGCNQFELYVTKRSVSSPTTYSRIMVKRVQQDATIAFFIRNGFTLHVSRDNLAHNQEYNAVYGHR